MIRNHHSYLPDHYADRKPPKKCPCGCGRIVGKGNTYATKECHMLAHGRGRYRTLALDLAGKR